MSENVARKLIGDHLMSGEMVPGEDIAIRIDQTLTQDATGTLVMQELEALHLDRARTEVSVQYVDHNLLQADEKNAGDHEYLRTSSASPGMRDFAIAAAMVAGRRTLPEVSFDINRPRGRSTPTSPAWVPRSTS